MITFFLTNWQIGFSFLRKIYQWGKSLWLFSKGLFLAMYSILIEGSLFSKEWILKSQKTSRVQ